MPKFPVYLDPVSIPEFRREVASEWLDLFTGLCKAAIEVSGFRDGSIVAKSAGVDGSAFRWEDVRRVFYAIEFAVDYRVSRGLAAYASLHDGRLVGLHAKFRRMPADLPWKVRIDVWPQHDWDAFMGEIRTYFTGEKNPDLVMSHAMCGGTVLERI